MKWVILIIILKSKFDDMIADMLTNKKSNPIVTELFIRGRKLNISLVFYTTLFCFTKLL